MGPSPIELARVVGDRLERAGIAAAEARLDAELLVRHLLGWDRVQWLTRGRESRAVPLDALETAVARRVAREPMAYLLGQREFWGRPFDVTPDVLVPRPETEILVERSLGRLGCDAAALVADVGTGSGCLAVSLALERPRIRVVATDLSWQALEVARGNARRHQAVDQITFCWTSLLDCLPAACLDLVASNPPYVPVGCRSALPPEVREYEPACALFAGPDGLDVIRPLVEDAARTLRPGGWLLFEFGLGQAGAVHALLAEGETWTEREIVPDLQGIPRTAIARKRDRP